MLLSTIFLAYNAGKAVYHACNGESNKALKCLGGAALTIVTAGIIPPNPVSDYLSSHPQVVKGCKVALSHMKV